LDDQPARQAAYNYRSEADKVQREIIAPEFLAVLPTTVSPWYAPGTPVPDPIKAAVNRAVDVNHGRRPVPQQRTGNAAGPNGGRAAARDARTPQLNVPIGGNGGVNVANLVNDINVMVHDITVQDGHTYRYKIHYELSNPVWDSANLATKELSSQFSLISKDSDDGKWTQPISVRSTTRIFVTNVSSMTGKVRFDMFQWKDGKWAKTQVEAVPGDSIKDETVVDIRQDPAKPDVFYVLLVDENGALVKKDKRTDSMDPEYDQLKNLTSGLPAGQAAAR
jgi:hypothetical protein